MGEKEGLRTPRAPHLSASEPRAGGSAWGADSGSCASCAERPWPGSFALLWGGRGEVAKGASAGGRGVGHSFPHVLLASGRKWLLGHRELHELCTDPGQAHHK